MAQGAWGPWPCRVARAGLRLDSKFKLLHSLSPRLTPGTCGVSADHPQRACSLAAGGGARLPCGANAAPATPEPVPGASRSGCFCGWMCRFSAAVPFPLCSSAQGTPLKKDGEDCGSEGRGIAARILGPSKPVSAGHQHGTGTGSGRFLSARSRNPALASGSSGRVAQGHRGSELAVLRPF